MLLRIVLQVVKLDIVIQWFFRSHIICHSWTMHESILGKDDIFKTIHFIRIRFHDCYCGINNSVIHAVTVNNVASVLFFRLSSATYALFDLGKYLEGKLS